MNELDNPFFCEAVLNVLTLIHERPNIKCFNPYALAANSHGFGEETLRWLHDNRHLVWTKGFVEVDHDRIDIIRISIKRKHEQFLKDNRKRLLNQFFSSAEHGAALMTCIDYISRFLPLFPH
ncbi:MAG: hypothetical protein J1F67_05020 [Muribaculaceae bacterium]|nr:hypothetical protein [Muribaculaceae bacterium]